MATKIQCPNPEHQDSTPSFALYANGGYCFGCGYRLTASELAKACIYVSSTESVRTQRSGAGTPLSHINWYAHALTKAPLRDRLEWFYSRGFSHRTIEDNLFGHNGREFVIPLWHNGTYAGVQFRRDDEQTDRGPKYRTPRGQPVTTFRS